MASHVVSAMAERVGDVLLMSPVGQVAQAVVRAVPIQVADLLTLGAWPEECGRNKPMDAKGAVGNADRWPAT